MGLIYQTTRWLDRLWSEHLEMSSPARDLVEAGVRKQGDAFAGFPADLHARLHLPAAPATKDGPAWAVQLHGLASELGEWQWLRAMCSRNGFAAGIATEAMLGCLLPLVPELGPAQRRLSGSSSASLGPLFSTEARGSPLWKPTTIAWRACQRPMRSGQVQSSTAVV